MTPINYQELLESTEDGILLVDQSLCIRYFSAAAGVAFDLKTTALGSSLETVAYYLGDLAQLLVEVRQAIATGKRSEEHARDSEGRHYLKRVVPCGSSDGQRDGALITVRDVSRLYVLEKHFSFALEAAGMAWWDWDLKTGKLTVRATDNCILGEDCEDLPNDQRGWMERVHPDDRGDVERSLKQHLQGKTESWQCVHRFKATDGEWLWVRNAGRIVGRDAENRPLEMMGTTQDIDAQQKATLRSNFQREILEAAGEIILLGAWEWDPETNLVYYSDRTREILGVSKDFVPGAEDSWKFFPQPDRDILAAAFYKLLEDGTQYDLEIRCINSRGEHLLTRAAGRPQYDAKGKLLRVVGVFQDITQVTRNEHEMRAYFSMSPDFQATLDFEGNFQSFSPSWIEGLGYTRNELNTMPASQLIHPAYVAEFEAVIARVIKGDVVNSHETKVLPKDPRGPLTGDEWMSWSLSSDPKLGLIFVSARSVTQQKQAADALNNARLRAEEANRVKTDFLSVMSHELRTPLNPILGFAEMLLADADDAATKRMLETIVSAGTHMTGLINELLMFSKIDAGMLELTPVEFSLPDFMATTVRFMRVQINDKPITLSWEMQEGVFAEKGLPPFLGDEAALRQICRNLISNAIKFTEAGEVVFRVKADAAEEGRAQLAFEVADTGIGIDADPAVREKLFEPFTQADSSLSRSYGGAGLGLAICRRLIGLMQGTIAFDSEIGVGTVFRVEVPVAYRAQSAEMSPSMPRSSVFDSGTPSQKKPRVLVLEDNIPNMFMIEEVLKRLGCESFPVGSGERALEVLENEAEKFDLILLDLQMPGIGGMAVLEATRKKELSLGIKRRPVVILTADANVKTSDQCYALGADKVFTKPLKLELMRDAIHRLARP